MKNIFLSLSFILVLGGNVQAQTYTGINDMKIQLGVSPYGYGEGLVGVFNYGLHDIFSIGVGTEFYFNENNSNFYLFGRADAHIGRLIEMPENMDLYPGIDLGILDDKLGFGAHIGYHYFFHKNIGAYIEIGSRGNLGLVFNL